MLLTVAFALGTPTLLSWGTERMPRLVIQLLHRNISLLVVVFVFLHVASTVIDGYAPIGWVDAIVPFSVAEVDVIALASFVVSKTVVD